MIRSVSSEDAPQIAAIYSHYVQSTTISFEEKALSGADMASRLAAVEAAGLPWLVAERDGQLLGFACASPWKVRHAYRHSVEISIYLQAEQRGAGTGSALYHALFAALRQRRVHAVLACIALPNAHSVALHEKFGMRKVAHFAEVGYKFGRWLDVGYWQLNFDGDV
jgi:L-amino acid N-acyltransferase YncA